MVPYVSFTFNGMVGRGYPCFQWFSMVGRVMDFLWVTCVFNGILGHVSPCFLFFFYGGLRDRFPLVISGFQ